MQSQPLNDITKKYVVKDYCNHVPGPQLADSHLTSNQDLVALSNSDLNLLGEFAFDNT